MRVCQFRHFGTGANIGQSHSFACSDSSVPKQTLAVNTHQHVPLREEFLRKLQDRVNLHLCHGIQRRKPISSTVCDLGRRVDGMQERLMKNSEPMQTAGIPAAGTVIPEDLALEIRKLAHDLSNALEIIVQTGYLLSTADLKSPASDWLRMLDSGTNKALEINLALRDYIKAHTPR